MKRRTRPFASVSRSATASYYWLTIATHRTTSGITGDDQDVLVVFDHTTVRPDLTCDGVPELML